MQSSTRFLTRAQDPSQMGHIRSNHCVGNGWHLPVSPRTSIDTCVWLVVSYACSIDCMIIDSLLHLETYSYRSMIVELIVYSIGAATVAIVSSRELYRKPLAMTLQHSETMNSGRACHSQICEHLCPYLLTDSRDAKRLFFKLWLARLTTVAEPKLCIIIWELLLRRRNAIGITYTITDSQCRQYSQSVTSYI